MTKDAEFKRRLDQLVHQMQWEEHERTWRDREVTKEDARRAMGILRRHEEPVDPLFLESLLSRSIGRVCRRLEVLEAEIASVRREREVLVARLAMAEHAISRMRVTLGLEPEALVSDVAGKVEALAERARREWGGLP